MRRLLREIIVLGVLVLGDDLSTMLSHAAVRVILIDDLLLDDVFFVASLEQALALGRLVTLDYDYLFRLMLLLSLSGDSRKADDTEQAEDSKDNNARDY